MKCMVELWVVGWFELWKEVLVTGKILGFSKAQEIGTPYDVGVLCGRALK